MDFLEMYKKELAGLAKKDDYKTLLLGTIKKDAASRTGLIEYFLPLVVELAEQYKDCGVKEADLIQEGNLGLTEGVDTFAKNCEDAADIREEDFIAHITQSIIEGFMAAVNSENVSASISEHLAKRLNAVSDAAEEIAARTGREATLEELCEYLSLSADEVLEAIRISLNILSLEK